MLNKISIKIPCELGATVWVKLVSDNTIHSGTLLGLKVDENDTNIRHYLVKVSDANKSFVKNPIDVSFLSYFDIIYSKEEQKKLKNYLIWVGT